MPDHNIPTFPPMTGRVFQTSGMGRIRLDQILGQGGFGAVYEAVAFEALQEPRYAVKLVIRNPATENAQAREIALHKAVSSHANVVDIHHAEFIGDYPLIVLGPRATEKIKHAFSQILDAVEHCHEQGVYHRGLKPENILVGGECEDIHVLLTDFGLSSDKEYVKSYYLVQRILTLMGVILQSVKAIWILQMVLTLDGSERLGISELHSILNMMKTFSSSVTNDSSVLGSGEVEFSQSQELGVQSVDYVQECGPAKNDAVCLLKLKDTVQSGLTIYNDCVPTFV
ncbi:kinase-like domain-containing protein [Pterulicium gracile]|uniref:Kinase-like domain-containing protein n=1 Tax=Pterulicium gracile TaxID=1884261 RepID=A0A5C3QRR0_9AGAR|nr:kinase-like domain-containing protein [Pterula gracilis]